MVVVGVVVVGVVVIVLGVVVVVNAVVLLSIVPDSPLIRAFPAVPWKGMCSGVLIFFLRLFSCSSSDLSSTIVRNFDLMFYEPNEHRKRQV